MLVAKLAILIIRHGVLQKDLCPSIRAMLAMPLKRKNLKQVLKMLISTSA